MINGVKVGTCRYGDGRASTQQHSQPNRLVRRILLCSVVLFVVLKYVLGMATSDFGNKNLKFCRYCEEWVTDFKDNQTYCDPCWKVYKRRQYHIAKHKARLMAAQGSKCAICDADFAYMPSGKIHVDHLHGDRYLIRGLLCLHCNSILGHSLDRPHILRKAAAYLEESEARPLEDILEELDRKDSVSKLKGVF